jgi:hypothetical protein
MSLYNIMCHVDKTTASVCVYLYVLVLQTIQIYRTFYVFHRFACDLSYEPVENSIFSIDLYGRKQTSRIFCVSYLFECNANLLLNSYFYSISTQGKPVANFKFSTNLHGM